MADNVIAIIQARCSSERLPDKVMRNLCGYPMIWHIFQRASSCKNVDKVVVVTSEDASDDRLSSFCMNNSIEVFRGDLTNVLSRFTGVIKKYKCDYFVRITGDCPLIHPQFIDKQIEALKFFNADFIRLSKSSAVLEGQLVQSSLSLLKAEKEIEKLSDLEHVGSQYFAVNINKFRVVKFSVPKAMSRNDLKITVDEEEDYLMMSKLYDELYSGVPICLIKAMEWLNLNPSVASMNSNVRDSKINEEISNRNKSSYVDFCGQVNW